MNSLVLLVVVVFLQGVGHGAPITSGLVLSDVTQCDHAGRAFKTKMEASDKVKDVEYRCVVIPSNGQKV